MEFKRVYISSKGKTQHKPEEANYSLILIDDDNRVVKKENYINNVLVTYSESCYSQTEQGLIEIQSFYRASKSSYSKSSPSSEFSHVSTSYNHTLCDGRLRAHFIFDAVGSYLSTVYEFYDHNGILVRSINHTIGNDPPEDILYSHGPDAEIIAETWYSADGTIKERY